MENERRTFTPEDPQRIYETCHVAKRTIGMIYEPLYYQPRLWRREILAFLSCTGWRIGQTLWLEWADVDLTMSELCWLTMPRFTLHNVRQTLRQAPLIFHIRRICREGVTISGPPRGTET